MNKEPNNQYHPSVCAGLHIILEEDEQYLSFEEEHKLGTGSKSIDCLIIKKNPKVKIKKRIGQIFLGHNLIEIKGYGDNLSVDNFYRALGYSFFYKADTGKENSIDITDMTLTFICTSMPIKLLKHLKVVWEIECAEKWKGIYYLEGFIIPMQLVVASKLDKEENLWIRSLLIPVKEEEGKKLSESFEKNKDNIYYEKAFAFILKKDEKVMKEVADMRESIRFLFREELEEKLEERLEEHGKEIAKRFLKRGLSCEIVSEDTGLDLKEVIKLQEELL